MLASDQGDAQRRDLDSRALPLFQEFWDLGPEQQRERLASLPADLADRVRELLASDTERGAGDFERELDGPRQRLGADLDHASRPTGIAGYQIIDEIGRGGMGVVYRARQHHPERTVAIKVMRPGVSSDEMLRRFEFEAEVLARLDHPGIAQIIETGNATVLGVDVPFFAMQLIEGEVLTRAADNMHLGIRSRVMLLREIALAVHHAHLNGVVHRDLKPSNILVGTDGCARVLDFGVARAVSTGDQLATLHTKMGEIVGTLAYMSPEQVSGDSRAIDVRTDVYSLGAIAYELLSGRLPFDLGGKPLLEAARIIQEQEALPLGSGQAGQAARRLRGDLQTIVGKAMEKDKTRRYSSAQALADDLRRYMDHEPISAHPPTTIYQLRKFSRRHRVFLSALTAVMLTLIISLFNVGRSARRAMAAERVAVSEAEVQTAVNGFIERMFGSIDPRGLDSTGVDTRVVDVLRVASTEAGEGFADHPRVELALRRLFANTYGGLTDTTNAEKEIDRALVLCNELGLSGREYRECLTVKAGLRSEVGRGDEAEPILRELIVLTQEAEDATAEDLCGLYNSLALALHVTGRGAEAVAILQEVQPTMEAGLGPAHPEFLTLLHNLAILIAHAGDFPGGALQLTRVLELRRQHLGPAHMQTMLTQTVLGSLLSAMDKPERAESLLREGVELRHKVLGPDNMHTWDGESALAYALSRKGECDEALRRSKAALENIVRLQGIDGMQSLDIRDYHALSLERCGELAQAQTHWRVTWEGLVKLPANHSTAAAVAGRLIDACLRRERPADALEPSKWALDWALAQHPPDDDATAQHSLLRAKVLIGVGLQEDARAALRRWLDPLNAEAGVTHTLVTEGRALLGSLAGD